MSPGSHLLLSWLSSVNILRNRRERVLVSLAGVAPDMDGLGLVIDKFTGTTNYFFQYHHYLGHSIFSAIVISTIASIMATAQRSHVWCLSFFVVHLHLLCDVVGSKGPEGHQWPIYYFYPLNTSYKITWKHQWELNAWQNLMILGLLLAGSAYYAKSKKITFFEIFSSRLNERALKMYHKYIR